VLLLKASAILVQSLDSRFFLPHMGAEPGRAGEKRVLLGFSPEWGGKKGESRDWTSAIYTDFANGGLIKFSLLLLVLLFFIQDCGKAYFLLNHTAVFHYSLFKDYSVHLVEGRRGTHQGYW